MRAAFLRGPLSRYLPWGAWFCCIIRQCGEIENLRAQSDFSQQNRSSRKGKHGSGRPILIFPALSDRRTEVCSKIRKPRARRLFRVNNPQVEALPLSDVVDMPEICRISPVLAGLRGQHRVQFHCFSRNGVFDAGLLSLAVI